MFGLVMTGSECMYCMCVQQRDEDMENECLGGVGGQQEVVSVLHGKQLMELFLAGMLV